MRATPSRGAARIFSTLFLVIKKNICNFVGEILKFNYILALIAEYYLSLIGITEKQAFRSALFALIVQWIEQLSPKE